ncbi:MAG: desulfoferrodoxin [Spirochaetaceae bacterium]|nr:desulfoferrodoxin [Spirochaetaceae bacterium]
MKDEFIICGDCKSVLHKLPGTVSNAKSGMNILEAGVTDGAKEKHIPVVKVEGNNVTVKVGSMAHPMTQEHYILWIMLRTDKGFMYRILEPNQEAVACFTLQENEKPLTVYEMCNIHGLWKTEL